MGRVLSKWIRRERDGGALRAMAGALSLLLLLVIARPSPAQSHETPRILERWGTAEGLPQNSVRAIAQTGDGYLWLGTYGGLVRYDGLRFQTLVGGDFEPLAAARLTALYDDGENGLWAGTVNHGIAHISGQKIEWHRHLNPAEHGVVWGLQRGPRGQLWTGCRHFARFDGERWIRHPLVDGDDDGVTRLARRTGELWIARLGSLEYLDASGAIHRVLEGPEFWSLMVDREGGVWAGTVEGDLFWVPPGRHRPLGVYCSARKKIWDLLEDRRGGIWAAADDGLHHAPPVGSDGATHFPDFRRIDLDEFESPVTALHEDPEGSLWIGSDTQGLIRMRREPFRHYQLVGGPTGVANWIGAFDGVVHALSQNYGYQLRGLEFVPESEGNVNEIFDACYDPSGRRWRIRGERLECSDRTRPVARLQKDDRIRRLLMDDTETVWLLSEFGLWTWTSKLTQVADLSPLGPSSQQFLLGFGPGGDLWFSLDERVYRFRNGALEFLSSSASWPRHTARSLHMDATGTAWIATYGGGLVRYREGEEPTAITEVDGLPDNALGGILEDDSGRLWINSNSGVFSAELHHLEAHAEGRLPIVPSRLLLTGEGNGGSAARSSDGRLWFPTLKGIVAIDPARQPLPPPPPTVVIESIRVESAEVDLAGAITIPPGKSDFEVRYTAPSFLAPRELLFRHRLSGYDETWSEPRSDRVIRYTNLRPGSYTLAIQVRSSQGGEWQRETVLQVQIEPLFWQTPWFLALLGAGLGLLLLAAHLLRTRAIRHQNSALSREIEQREVAERHLLQNEALLRASEERNRLLVENAPETIMIIDPEERRILGANGRVEKLLGRTPAELEGESILQFAHDATARRAIDRALGEAPETEASSIEASLRGTGDRELLCELRLVRTQWQDREVIQSSISDVTERRRVEEHLQQKSKIEAIGSLAGSVAHEINNILTAMSGHVERLEGQAPETSAPSVPELRTCIEHAASVTQQLLAFGKKQTTVAKEFSLDEELRSMEPVLRRLLRDDIALQLDLDAGGARLHADPHQLQQILFNLLVNAVDALPDGGRIRIITRITTRTESTDDTPHWVNIEVRDSGPGIPEAILDRIFDPFFSTKEGGSGTGLGLSTVQRIAEQLGGTIVAGNADAGGATFVTSLPARVDREASAPSATDTLPPNPPRATVLVCDDFEPLLQIVASPLESRGYQVLRASSPAQALHLAQSSSTPLDLLITDVVMPAMNGRELKAAIEELHPGIAVLFMSGYDADIVARRGVVEVDTHFIHKPFTMRDMGNRVDAILGGREEHGAVAEA